MIKAYIKNQESEDKTFYQRRLFNWELYEINLIFSHLAKMFPCDLQGNMWLSVIPRSVGDW